METIKVEVERRKAIDHEVNNDQQDMDNIDEGTDIELTEESADGTHWLEGDDVLEESHHCDD